MALNISNSQIAQELDLDLSVAQHIADLLRTQVHKRRNALTMNGKVEFYEVYIIAGHKGQSGKIKGCDLRRNRLRCARGRGTMASEKPPVFGMIERGFGLVRLILLENVQQGTIKPYIIETFEKGTQVYTDEYNTYARLEKWGYLHKTVCHGKGEYARDEDGDGFHELHVNTMEGFWSLLRSWLRPHCGISQEKLPLYLHFFEFVHNSKRRGKAMLSSIVDLLLL